MTKEDARLFFLYLLPLFSFILSPCFLPPLVLSEGKTDYSREIRLFLKATQLENKNKMAKSYAIWQKLIKRTPHSPLVYHYYLKTGLAIGNLSPVRRFKRQKTKKPETIILLSRFFSWKKKYKSALKILSFPMNSSEERVACDLEKAGIYLYLGEYGMMRRILTRLRPVRQRNRFQKDILWYWLYILENDRVKIQKKYTELEKNYLYFVPDHLTGISESFENENSFFTDLKLSHLRFPQDLEIKEDYILSLYSLKKWEELKWLFLADKKLLKKPGFSEILVELRHNTIFSEEDNILFSNFDNTSANENLDILAREAVINNQWERLRKIALEYIKNFPMINDGKLYLAEYYKGVGNNTKSKEILDQLRHNDH